MTISNRAAILMEIATEAQTNPEYWKEFQYYTINFRYESFKSEEGLLTVLSNGLDIRRKPFVKPTRKIGDYDVPYPVQEPLNYGEDYFTFELGGVVVASTWYNDLTDMVRFSNGLVFKDKSDADCVQKALLSLTRVNNNDIS